MAKNAAGGKSKKHGRNAARCAAYKASYRSERNKARRLSHVLKKHPEDKDARAAFDKLMAVPFRNVDKDVFKARVAS